MKTATIITTLLSTLALAGPVKRHLVTEWDVVTVTVFETATATATADTVTSHASATHLPHTVHQTSDAATSVAFVSSTLSTSSTPSTSATLATQSAPAVFVPATSSASFSAQCSDTIDYSALSDYAAPILKQHNIHRCNHTSPPLQWDQDLADIAKEIADLCVYAHTNAFGDGKYGQNIGAGAPPSEIPKMITDLMYNNEMIQYPGYNSEPDMSNFEAWGHFSQIVWKDTLRVGCYTTLCSTLKNVGSNVNPYLTVCNYRPQGNFGGQYMANVLKPLGQPSIVL